MATLRLPSSLSSSSSSPSPSIPPPSLSFLHGTWNVTHSTLPMWKTSRNVRITYTPIPGTSPPHLDDTVTYQPLRSTALKSVHGVDKPFDTHTPVQGDGDDAPLSDTASLAYNWRGKGWLMIASSKWEILGYGEEDGDGNGNGAAGNSWMVTYFAKTLFTPAGIDFYSRKGTLRPETVQSLKAALAALGGGLQDLAANLFDVAIDHDRQD